MKGHPQAGHMGFDLLTLKKVPLLKVVEREGEKLLVVKGSLPGAKNGRLKFFVE